MNRERARELLPIIQAIADGVAYGEQIQERYADDDWRPLHGPWMLNDSRYSYRIKPEPREYWIRLSNGRVIPASRGYTPNPAAREGWIKVREVLE